MSEITISSRAQTIGLLAAAGFIGMSVMAQMPEIRRYLKIKRM